MNPGGHVFAWPADNDSGRELLETEVRPLVASLGATLETPSPGDDRRRMVAALRKADAVVIDGSVETGHVYHKFVELVKTSNNALLVSRTALPRNVYAFHQLAPAHAHYLENDVLGQWLHGALPAVLEQYQSERGYLRQMFESLDEQSRWIADQTGVFVSFRGTHHPQALQLRERISSKLSLPARVVPPGQFVYETECMPRQRMWEIVARIEREIHFAPGLVILRSRDYFDSFWTCSELLIALFHRLQPDGSIAGGWLVEPEELDLLRPLGFSGQPDRLPVPLLAEPERKEYRRLLRQSDPGTVAPEMRRANSGLSGLVFRLLYRLSRHSETPQDDAWWHEFLVPCPKCRPSGRDPRQLCWADHLRAEGYGYFGVAASQIRDGATVQCPACSSQLVLRNRREPRVLWVPGPLGRPWPEDMEVLEKEAVLEVGT